MIKASHVSKIYTIENRKLYALKDASFHIKEGEFVVILGPSGAGKSTLLNILGGIDTMDEGDVMVNGSSIKQYQEKELSDYRAKMIGFIFQFYNLIPTLTVYENVALMKELNKDCLDAHKVLADVGLQDHGLKFPSQLSGGEQQRVSIARALCKNPKVLLCDEPTGALDSETGKIVLSLLQDMCHTYHKTTILVTHNAAIAKAADKVIHIHNGRITEIICNEHPCEVKEVNW